MVECNRVKSRVGGWMELRSSDKLGALVIIIDEVAWDCR